MYWWHIRNLRQQLAQDGLSESHAFRYYLATAILSALLYEAVANGPPSETKAVDILDASLYLGFTIGGTVWCYRQNGGAAGRDFLIRIVPIAWVMFWRLMSVVIPFFIIVGAVDWYQTGNLGRPGSEMTLLVIIMNGLFGGMWWRMGVHMKWVVEHAEK
ncbi:MAG: hypothetical protein ACR2PZ_25935 [Pseudomonadales bacterium]